ncbi:DUF262 domain-containing protein [Chromobacterium vaccinii]|uniref:DUF262 domain-containing protein n=1 Tax=Chromobacterium vaccinii TaxID=1108595 RepID=UPI0009E5406F|nr:DUF262 domain-containing protein [Chromobacterium vaccinii]
MRVNTSGFTIAEYCDQMNSSSIIVNKSYQRSNQIWPISAKSFLIDSILNGYPIPKISLFQKTNPNERRTTKEIIDGQQRSSAIKEFYEGKFKITTKGEFYGMNFNNLPEEDKANFLEYTVSVDVFTGATEENIRELFRRINAYNVPLNPQEQRHATYQGDFKWFIWEQSNKYSNLFEDFGTFGPSSFARMEDAKFIADLCLGFEDGIISASEKKLDLLYKKHDKNFDGNSEINLAIQDAINFFAGMPELWKTQIFKKYQLYCMLIAHIVITKKPVGLLEYWTDSAILPIEEVKFNLSTLAEGLQSSQSDNQLIKSIIENSAKTTDRKEQRKARTLALIQLLTQRI